MSNFSRKYLLTVLPILISFIYNIPKFFEIVKCSDKELYITMIKSYYKNDINATIIRENEVTRVTPSDVINQLYLQQNQTNFPYNNISLSDSLSKNNTFIDSFSKESNIEEEMSNFFSTSHQNHVLDDLNDNDILCDYYGHRVSTFRKNRWYIIFYHFFSDLFLVKVIPWLTVIAFNTRVYIASRKFRRMRQRLLNRTENVRGRFIAIIQIRQLFATFLRIKQLSCQSSNFTIFVIPGTNDGKQTNILLSIAFVFVFCQCFTIIPDVHELICTISGNKCKDIIYTYNIIEFGHLMLAVNSSVNFVFYIIHIQLLREEIQKVFQSNNWHNQIYLPTF